MLPSPGVTQRHPSGICSPGPLLQHPAPLRARGWWRPSVVRWFPQDPVALQALGPVLASPACSRLLPACTSSCCWHLPAALGTARTEVPWDCCPIVGYPCLQ